MKKKVRIRRLARLLARYAAEVGMSLKEATMYCLILGIFDVGVWPGFDRHGVDAVMHQEPFFCVECKRLAVGQ